MTPKMGTPLEKYSGKGIGNYDGKAEIASSKIDDIIKKYEALLPVYDFKLNSGRETNSKNGFKMALVKTKITLNEILTPTEIRGLNLRFLAFKHCDGDLQGDILTRLIQNSYNAGHNGFTAVVNDSSATQLGLWLKAKKSPLVIAIEGDSYEILSGCENVKATINGDYSNIGGNAFYSEFNIKGNSEMCGERSEHCTFVIEEEASSIANDAKDCTFIIKKDFESMNDYNEQKSIEQERCTFIAYNKSTYYKMRKLVQRGNDNKIILKDKNDKIKWERTL